MESRVLEQQVEHGLACVFASLDGPDIAEQWSERHRDAAWDSGHRIRRAWRAGPAPDRRPRLYPEPQRPLRHRHAPPGHHGGTERSILVAARTARPEHRR